MLSRAIASQGYLNRILLNNTRASCLRLNTWHLPVSDVRCHSRTTWPFASLVKPNHQCWPLVSDVVGTESCHLSDIESRYLSHIRITKSCHLYYIPFFLLFRLTPAPLIVPMNRLFFSNFDFSPSLLLAQEFTGKGMFRIQKQR